MFAPLGLLGFSPAQIGVYYSALLAWSVCTHSEWIPRLGPLEWVLVTPSRHRLHHSPDRAIHDHNYGGLLIVWDILFRSAAREGPQMSHRFGLDDYDAKTQGPVATAFYGWRALIAHWKRPRKADLKT